jgi:ATP-binding cassette, subfamily B, multidrug efflux pump
LNSLKTLNKYFYRYKYRLILGTLFVIISNIFAIVPAQLVRKSFDLVKENLESYSTATDIDIKELILSDFGNILLIYALSMLGMALLRGVFLFYMRQTIIVMSRFIENDLKDDIFHHYQSLPLAFYRRNNTGDLMARISEDVARVRMYLGPAIMYGINLAVLFILVIGYMLMVNVKLTFYVLLPLPLLSISIFYVNNLINKRSDEIQKSLSRLSTFVQESFSGIRVLKSFVREDDFANNFAKESTHYRERSLKLTLVNALFFPLILLLIGASTLLVVYVGGIEVTKGTITTGNIAEFIIYINMLTWPVTSLGWVTSIVQRAAASQARINEFLEEKNTITSDKNLSAAIEGTVEFKNVSLVYPDSGIEAFKNVSFTIKKGQKIAIIGNTGSGKSTLAALLCRMYDPSEGEILIDGINLKDYNVSGYRNQLGYVPQEVFLFSESIRNNILFGKKETVSEEKMIEAAKDADLYNNIIQFTKKFDTEIGERGITLSGGQKQRLAIARAIVKEPKILILDDCLSAVDTKTENTILTNLEKIMKNRTSIIISHRVSSVKLADKILVLENGKLVEEGKHEDLLKLNGHYKAIYEKQLIETV